MSFLLRATRLPAARPLPVAARRAFGSTSIRALKESDRGTFPFLPRPNPGGLKQLVADSSDRQSGSKQQERVAQAGPAQEAEGGQGPLETRVG